MKNNDQLKTAISDLLASMGMWRVWHHLAIQNIRQRYRRTLLGPFWLSLSVGVQLTALGVLGGLLFGIPVRTYMPYLAAGLIIWTYFVSSLSEGAGTFIGAANIILHVKRPLASHLILTLWRNILVLCHHLVILVIIFPLFSVYPNFNTLLLLVTFPLLVLNLMWMTLILSVLSARFRDIPQIVNSAIMVVFWLTPIFYMPKQLGEYSVFIYFNPMTHLLAIVREPLLGEAPSFASWAVVIGMAIAGWAAALPLYARFRSRVPYWL